MRRTKSEARSAGAAALRGEAGRQEQAACRNVCHLWGRLGRGGLRRLGFCLYTGVFMAGCGLRVAAPPAAPVVVVESAVRLPGLSFLTLGMPQPQAVSALRQRGYACDEYAAPVETRTLACAGSTRWPGATLVLEFMAERLAAVQLQPELLPKKDIPDVAAQAFQVHAAAFRAAHGAPEEIRRPGIAAQRYRLADGTTLVLVYYEGADGATTAEPQRFSRTDAAETVGTVSALGKEPAALTLEHVGGPVSPVSPRR